MFQVIKEVDDGCLMQGILFTDSWDSDDFTDFTLRPILNRRRRKMFSGQCVRKGDDLINRQTVLFNMKQVDFSKLLWKVFTHVFREEGDGSLDFSDLHEVKAICQSLN